MRLLEAAKKHIDALEKEAKANMAYNNAEANFSNARPERRKWTQAAFNASIATKELREAIAEAEAAAISTKAPEQAPMPLRAPASPEPTEDQIRVAIVRACNINYCDVTIGEIEAYRAALAAKEPK